MAEFKVIETQEQLDEIIGARLKRERETFEKKYANYFSPDDLKNKTEGFNTQIKSLQEAIENEKQKNADFESKIADLTAKNAKYETDSVKTRIAAELGLPYELMSRLNGNTEDEIREDAKSLLSVVNKHTTPPMASTEQGGTSDSAYKELLNGLKLN